MKCKIAIIDSLGAHGCSHHLYLYGQASWLADSNIDVSIYTNNVTKNPSYNGVGFFQFYRNIFNSRFKFISGIRHIIGSIFSIIHAKISGVNICHYHLFHANILVMFDFILTKILRMRVVYTVHDVVSFENNRINQVISNWIYRGADKILIHNQFSANIIKKSNKDVSSIIDVIPHGNYLPFLSGGVDKDISREIIGIGSERKVLLFFGMIKKVKGLEIMLESLKNIVLLHPDVLLVIAGRVWKNNFSVYQEIIDKYNLSDNCLIHNRFIPQDDIKHYYASSDIVVLPYKRIYQSGVLLMSMSYEKIVLVSDLPPMIEVIEDNKTGFVFKTENPTSLANKVNNIFENIDALDHIKENALRLMKSDYDWREIGRKTRKSYESIL